MSDVCPTCGAIVGDGGSTIGYNGFDIRVCGPECKRDFTAMPTRRKDAFVGRFVEPVSGGCPLMACCAVRPGAPVVTYNGSLIQLCCQPCLNWWENANDEARSRVYTTKILPSLGPPAGGAARPVLAAAISSDEAANGETVLRVGGMTCEGCVNAVKASLAAVDGVKNVRVRLDQGLAWVGFDTPGSVSSEMLVKAVEDAGFSAKVDGSARPTSAVPTRLVSIDDTLQPLIDRFNADSDKPRVVALLSPTCGGCVHAAKAIFAEAVKAYPDTDLSVFVVWEPMLGSDNEAAARESARIFDDPRVQQFWDAERLSGITYSAEVFPDRMRQIAEAMPDDHFLKGRFENAADGPPERVPMWDFAIFYPAGVEWTSTPPTSSAFIRQLAIRMTPTGTSATMLADDFTKPPIESDWFDEVRREMNLLLGPDAVARTGVASSSTPAAAACAGLPDSPTGRAARALVELTYTQGDDAVREFVEQYLTPGARERNSDEVLFDAFRQIRANLARAEVRSAVKTGAFTAQIVLASETYGTAATMDIEIEPDPPHRIDTLSVQIGEGSGDPTTGAAACSVVPTSGSVANALGIATTSPSPEIAAQMSLKTRIRTEGRVVSSVAPGSPAELSGLRPDDVILQLNDNRLYSQDDVNDFLRVAQPGEPIDVLVKRAGTSREESLQLTLPATFYEPSAADAVAIEWQYAGPGQLERALQDAREQGKVVMVGVSGSDTCCAFSRFEVDALSRILDDVEIVEGSSPFVRVIIRRPHAYWFLEEIAGFDGTGRVRAMPSGLKINDGELLPIPGIFFIDSDRAVLDQVALSGDDARDRLLRVMEQLGSS